MSEPSLHTFEIWQDDVMVVAVSGEDQAIVLSEARHYVAQYAQEGPMILKGSVAPFVFGAILANHRQEDAEERT